MKATVAPGARRSFAAQYDGRCTSCGAAVAPGDSLFYAPGNEAPSGLDCCGDRDDADLTVTQRREELSDDDMTVDAAKVMPHGRTARDMCSLCWQIPAANGSCGCDY